MYLVYDDTYMLSMVKLTDHGTEHMHQVNLFRPLFELFVKRTDIFLAFQSGDIEFF